MCVCGVGCCMSKRSLWYQGKGQGLIVASLGNSMAQLVSQFVDGELLAYCRDLKGWKE